MRLAQDLSGKQVITLDEGCIIGQVKDLYLNDSLTRLAGIHLGKEGLIRKKSLFISTDSVRVFGIDVMLIDENEAVKDSKAFSDEAEWVRMKNMIGREINTAGNTRIGTVADVAFDGDGYIIAFTLNKVYVDGPIRENRYIPIEAIIDNGGRSGDMIIDLAIAEGRDLPTTDISAPTKHVEELIESNSDEVHPIDAIVDNHQIEETPDPLSITISDPTTDFSTTEQ